MTEREIPELYWSRGRVFMKFGNDYHLVWLDPLPTMIPADAVRLVPEANTPAAREALIGPWRKVEHCTCVLEPKPGQHEPWCGWEPVAPSQVGLPSKVRAALGLATRRMQARR